MGGSQQKAVTVSRDSGPRKLEPESDALRRLRRRICSLPSQLLVSAGWPPAGAALVPWPPPLRVSQPPSLTRSGVFVIGFDSPRSSRISPSCPNPSLRHSFGHLRCSQVPGIGVGTESFDGVTIQCTTEAKISGSLLGNNAVSSIKAQVLQNASSLQPRSVSQN